MHTEKDVPFSNNKITNGMPRHEAQSHASMNRLQSVCLDVLKH